MQPVFSADSGTNNAYEPHYILLIDDNVQLRSLLARYIMLNCHTAQQSCSIYHLGERAEPRLTYHQPVETPEGFQRPLDFVVYEAISPRHALNWIKQDNVKRLTIISDIAMPLDTEIGLPGLIYHLHTLQVAVNLVFYSVEPNNRAIVEAMLGNKQAYFLIKGSPAWQHLPTALVQGASRFNYQHLARYYDADPSNARDQDVVLNHSFLNQSTQSLQALAQNPADPNDPYDYVIPVTTVAKPKLDHKQPGWLSRLFSFGRGLQTKSS